MRASPGDLLLQIGVGQNAGAVNPDVASYVRLAGFQRVGAAPFADRGAPGQDFVVDGRLQDRTGLVSPVGGMMAFAGTSAPSGWLLCDGAAVSRASYSELFAVVGTSYGAGNGSTTFHVPDLRGRTSVGAGAGPSLTARAVGQAFGAETHTLTVAELPSHTHQERPAGGVNWFQRYQTTERTWPGEAGGNILGPQTGPTGGGGAHNNLPPSLVANSIIKY